MIGDKTKRSEDEDDETLREGNVVFEERMNRRDGLVEYAGTVDGDEASDPPAATPSDQPSENR